MKILMLGWELPPYNTGGLGVACYQLCKALAQRGAEIDFVVPYHDKHESVDFMQVVPALPYSLEELRHYGGAYDSSNLDTANQPGNVSAIPHSLRDQQMGYTRAMRHITATKQYDVIHAHDWLTFEAGIAAKQLTGKPLIVHVHATEFDRAGGEIAGNPIVHDIEYAALCMADQIVAVSQATKNLIVQRYNIPATKISVIHNSIDASAQTPVDDQTVYPYLQLMKRHGYKVVVSLGRLTIQKGLTNLLHAAKLVIDKNPKILFLLAGTGEQYHELVVLSAELGISQNVLFTGQFVRGKAWRDTYAIGDMFVMPSVSEPFGITALEAVGYGIPTLISKQSGVGEVVKNVMKFDYWDTSLLAGYILAIAQHPALHKELQQNALTEFHNLSWHSVAETCQDMYDRIVKVKREVLA